MPYMNRVIIMGHLSRDPDMKQTQSGMSVCTFSVAVSEKRKDGKEETGFFDVTTFGKAADLVKKICSKGFCLLVEGRLKQDTWEDRNGGGKRSRIGIVAESVKFIGASKKSAGNAQNEMNNGIYGGHRYARQDVPGYREPEPIPDMPEPDMPVDDVPF